MATPAEPFLSPRTAAAACTRSATVSPAVRRDTRVAIDDSFGGSAGEGGVSDMHQSQCAIKERFELWHRMGVACT
jgi:hypothetical protein